MNSLSGLIVVFFLFLGTAGVPRCGENWRAGVVGCQLFQQDKHRSIEHEEQQNVLLNLVSEVSWVIYQNCANRL